MPEICGTNNDSKSEVLNDKHTYVSTFTEHACQCFSNDQVLGFEFDYETVITASYLL